MSIAEARMQFTRLENHLVRVAGVVTFSNQRMGLAFMQDATSGIGFDPRTGMMPLPRPGDMVEVTGVLARRQGMVMILRDVREFGAPEVTLASSAKPVVRAIPFDLDEARQMRINGLLTRVSGVVRRIVTPEEASAPMIVEITSPSGHATVRLPWRESKEVLDGWMNRAVTANAVLVCQAAPPLLAADADALLLVAGRNAWSVQPQALDEVFARPPEMLAGEIPVTPRTTMRNRLHIQGVVTAAKPHHWLSLRTNTGSVQVMTRQREDFVPGDKIAVACWPQNEGGKLVLLDGVCRHLERDAVPEPVQIGREGPVGGHSPMELVQATGTLERISIPGGVPRFALALAGGQSCLLQWGTFLHAHDVAALEDGSTLRVTGILNSMPSSTLSEAGVVSGIQPRTMADLQVLRGPSWWTPSRLKVAAWSLLGLLGVVLPTALFSRWQVRRQQRQLRAIESRGIAEEERKRISRELHDSLHQQLAGAALHLDTMQGAVHAVPEMLPRLINDTAAMIRHCQLEVRECIWDLRSQVLDGENLAAALKEWLHMRSAQVAGTELHFVLLGKIPPLGAETPLQIMRIAQEAVYNALAHAGARHVRVRLEGTPEEVLLMVEDDGRGFEINNICAGRFGLSSQRERAQRIGAHLDISSPPDEGARVLLRVPKNHPGHARTCH